MGKTALVSLSRPVLWVVLLSTALLGCQTAMSVEEAKKVTTAFSGASFVPPPRSLEDITAILDRQRRAAADAAAAARALADQSPPTTNDASALARFSHERGLAAQKIGRAKQQIEDLTKALGYSRSAGATDHHLLKDLAEAEMRGGNYSRAISYLRMAIDAVPHNQRGALIGLNCRLATVHAEWGDLKKAEAAFGHVYAVYSESLRWHNQRPEWVAARQADVAQTQAQLLEAEGRYAEAEALYRRTIATLAADAVYSHHTWIDEQHAFLARVLMRQERLLEAENEARRALLGALAKGGRYSTHTALILQTLVDVILEQGRYVDAEKLARARIDIYEQTGSSADSVLLAGARAQLATALALQERHREALAEYEAIRTGLAGDPDYARKLLDGHVGYAVALLRTGDADRALAVLGVALDKSTRLVGARHRNSAAVRSYIAQAQLARGDRRRALREFREATEVLLARSLDVDDESATRVAADRRLVDMLERYVELLADVRGTQVEREASIDAVVEAFRLAEIVRGRAVQRAVDASAARAAARTPALADLVRREQDAKKQMGALQGLLRNLLSGRVDQQDAAVIEKLRSQIELLRRARESLAQQIEREFPAYAQLIDPAPATLAQARASLRAGESLISIIVGTNRSFVWAVPPTGPVAFTTVPMGARAVEAAVAALRRALDPGAETVGAIPLFDVGAAHDLYRALLEPVASGWREARSLLIVPHGALGQLPFALLVTKPTTLAADQGALFANYRAVPWLVRSHAVTVLPSIGALATLRRLPPPDPGGRPFVGFGDPYFSQEQARRASSERSPVETAALISRGEGITLRNLRVESLNSVRLATLPRLPDTAEEVRAIALAMNADLRRDVFLGPEANEHRVKTLDLAAYRVIAFATHGLVPGDLDGLTQPALALSAPEVAGVDGDGLLTMEEILALRLNADWVVLSACNTASGRGAGSEAVSGLGRAFFYAGARALLVSNWPVETTSARALTTDLFRRQSADPRLGRARALQQTMNALIDAGHLVDPRTNRAVFSYAHPIFWAPFALVGDGGD